MAYELGVDEWASIAPFMNVEDWLSYALICKKSYNGLKKHLEMKQNLKRCMKCNGKTFRHEMPKNESCDEFFEKMGIENFFCVSGHENDEIWYICFECDVFHLECPFCKNYCCLVGFPGQKKSEDNEIDGLTFHIIKKGNKRIFNKFPDNIDFYDSYKKGRIILPEEWNILFLDRKKWYFTGSDGSMHSKMKCKSCKYKLSFTE